MSKLLLIQLFITACISELDSTVIFSILVLQVDDKGVVMASTTSSSVIYTANSEKTFHVADYVIFGALFLVSALIGLYFAIVDRNKKSTENYSLAGR